MINEYQIRVLPEQAASEQAIKHFIARDKGMDERTIRAVRVLKRSIDARQRTIFVNLTIRVFVNEDPTEMEYNPVHYRDVSDCPPVVVVGAGPGGLFAALRLIELGCRPIVVERGKDVRERKKDIARIRPEQRVDPESNYSFGEGGAGAYSDGKLYTRSKKRGNSEKILNVFVQHGASPTILSDAHPHIGTDKLPRVIENMRNTILRCGGEVHFQTRMEALILDGNQVRGIACRRLTEDGREVEFRSEAVILATGHSARDVYRWLYANGVEIEAKGLAVGVRLEHPSLLIDQLQYHNRNGRGKYLPAAEYSVVQQVEGRGVYSFCMCPGGFVVPAATGPEQIVVNGMSPSGRNGQWSNSGMVVELHPEDIMKELKMENGKLKMDTDEAMEVELSTLNSQQTLNSKLSTLNSKLSTLNFQPSTLNSLDPLCMMRFQEQMERDCWLQGNRQQTAPAQRMADFVNNRLSYDLPRSSYAPGLISSPLHFWMPKFVSHRLQEGFKMFGKRQHGFLTNEAVVIGVETRTSSPVRILRDNETLQHVRIEGLYPCGEGAGYAGGIVSAGVDGERCAESAASKMKVNNG